MSVQETAHTEAGSGAESIPATAQEPRQFLGRRRRALYLAVPYVLFIAALLAVETGTRLLLPRATALEVFVQSQHQRQSFVDAHQVSIFEGDPLLFWRLKPSLTDAVWSYTPVSTNAQGIRYASLAAPKPPGVTRIVCVGDSITFGWGLPTVSSDQPDHPAASGLPYTVLLERSLRIANPGRQIEVIPLAAPGYSTHQGLAWLRRDLGRLQPDLVVLLFGWNDAELRTQPDSEAMPADSLHVNLRRVLTSSQALSHAALWWRQYRQPDPKTSTTEPTYYLRVSPEEFTANLLEMSRLSQSHGAQVVVILGPLYADPTYDAGELARIQGLRNSLRAAVVRAALPYLEAPELTEANYPATKELFFERIHPNHEGHKLLAAKLLNLLASRQLLRDVVSPPNLLSQS